MKYINLQKVISIGFLLSATLTSHIVMALNVEVFMGKDVNSTIVSNETNSVLIDAQFKRSEALRLAAQIIESGKTLDTIYITHAHPDHVLGSEILIKIFPDAKLIARPGVIDGIKKNIIARAKKLNEMMGPNITPEFPMPEAYTDEKINLGEEEIVILDGLTGDSEVATAVYLPASKTLIAGDIVFGGTHLWTATSRPESRKAWQDTLAKLKAMSPEIVIPSHQMTDAKHDTSAIEYTQDYLIAFEANLADSGSPDELIEKMTSFYPQAGGMFYLKTAAKALLGGAQ